MVTKEILITVIIILMIILTIVHMQNKIYLKQFHCPMIDSWSVPKQ